MQKVLRLLDADERRRRRVVQKHEIREHLQRSVGRELRQHRVAEGRVLDLQQQTAVGHGLGQDPFDARHPLAQHVEDPFQPVGVLFGQILDDIGDVVPRLREPVLRARFGLTACALGRQIGQGMSR